jgi:hypothetical protein
MIQNRESNPFEATTGAVQAADSLVVRAIDGFTWERRGLLGRLVRRESRRR